MPAPILQIEDTPNPQAMKFIADRSLGEASSASFRSYRSLDEAEASDDTLAAAVFSAGSIVSVMIVKNFVTVNKKPSARWAKLQPKIEAVLRQHLDG